jgi:Xaa-Pro dipeptidase
MQSIGSQRLHGVREQMQLAHLDALVLSDQADVFYLTGWRPPAWASAHLVLSATELALVSADIPDLPAPVWTQTYPFESFHLDRIVNVSEQLGIALRAALAALRLGGNSVGMSAATLRADAFRIVAEMARVHQAEAVLAAATLIKDAPALAAIRERVQMLDHAFATAAATIRPGVREIDLFAAIYSRLAEQLSAPLTLDCCLGSGPRTLESEPQPTARRLAPGDLVLIDLFPNLGGYVADYTRTFVVGEPTPAQRQQHAALEQALHAVEAALRPGVTAAAIDALARKTLADAGFAAYTYQHHTGHGFGIRTPEAPWFIPADQTPLQAGMVVAIEPGIYHPVHGGMRLEGNYIITDEGCEALVGFPAELRSCY